MGSITGAISDDIEEYRELCKKYGEKIVYGKEGIFPDPYCDHAKKLKKRRDNDTSKDKRSICGF